MNVITQQFVEINQNARTHFILNHLDNNPRLLRLFGVACYRLIPTKYSWKECDNAIDVAEKYADKLLKEKEREAATNAIKMETGKSVNVGRAAIVASSLISFSTTFDYVYLAFLDYRHINWRKDLVFQTGEILTNMNRQIWDDSWGTKDVKALAETIYNDKRYELMPILSDALQEAGCQEKEILEYCQKGPFFRGCWVLDKATGKR